MTAKWLLGNKKKYPKNNYPTVTFNSQNNIKFIQINLHHAKGASAVLCKRFIQSKLDIAFIQEPWSNHGKILGIDTKSCKLIYDETEQFPRSAILVNGNFKILPITEFIKRDIVAVVMEIPTTRGKTEICVASAYFPGDVDDVPPPEVSAFVTFCKSQNKAFIIGCDANAHHTVWNSTDINTRGECLLEYLTKNNVNICNEGTNSTFMNSIRQEVLDLTLCSNTLSEKIHNWNVSDEISLSDHKHILFEYKVNDIIKETFRDPRKTNWEQYYSNLEVGGSFLEKSIITHKELENTSIQVTNRIIQAFNNSCPVKVRSTDRDVPWWNTRLENLRKQARKMFNRAKRTLQWDEYRKALTLYNEEIRRSKRKNWRHVCENIESTPVVARLQKVLSNDHSNGLGTLKNDDGSFTSNASETLNLMMQVHFPGSLPVLSEETTSLDSQTGSGKTSSEVSEEQNDIARITGQNMTREDTQDLASRIFTQARVEWAINSFEPFKSPGNDEIRPVMIQKSKGILIPCLTEMFRASLRLNYIPKIWRQIRVVFIPKANKKDKKKSKIF